MSDTPETRNAYYARTESWSSDRQDAAIRSRRVAWIVASAATAVALFEAIALSSLTPLKTVVPYTLVVDRTTGFVQVLKDTQPSAIANDTALTQSLLAQYVVAREGYDIGGVTAQYRKVALWSADNARREYLASMPATSAESPLRRYPRTTIVTVRVKSVSLTSSDSALVRFDTERLDGGQAAPQRNSWIALLRFRYSGSPMAIEDRLINPLGFQILRYQRDAEAPSVDPPPEGRTETLPIPRSGASESRSGPVLPTRSTP